MIRCTFACQPGKIRDGMETALESILSKRIEQHPSILFYIGGTGEFSSLCAKVIRRLRQQHPETLIRLVLVAAKEDQSLQSARKWLLEMYDEIIVPPNIQCDNYFSAQQQCEYWMIDHSDLLISHIHSDPCSTLDVQRYAVKKGLSVYNIE